MNIFLEEMYKLSEEAKEEIRQAAASIGKPAEYAETLIRWLETPITYEEKEHARSY